MLMHRRFHARTDFAGNSALFPPRPDGCLFPSPVCEASAFDTFPFATACWATLQLTWTIIVLGGQLFQITKQLTTYELSNLGRYGYMGGHGASLAAQASHRHEHPPHAHGHSHSHGGTGLLRKVVPKGLLQLVGLDLYTQGKAAEGIARAARQGGERGNNPFDVGLWRNCTDFWSRGRTLGVDYAALYEVPEGGFRAVVRRKEAAGGSGEGKARSLSTTGTSRGAYSMVPTDDA
jgi:palmitoyltransferase